MSRAWASSPGSAYGYLGSNMLALTMTLLIAAFYLMGAVELHRFRQATASLRSALEALPEHGDAIWATGWPRCTRRCAMRCACASKANASVCRARR